MPIVRFRLETTGLQRERWDMLTELILTHCMGWFIVVWVFFFGACLGSFLNVVAYRIPNGMTILGTSRCPWCLVPIESRFNLPIMGWLMLRGRCAACRLPIAIRYMLVEIVAGLILVWLFAFELVANGENLPRERDYRIQVLFRQLASGNLKEVLDCEWALVRIFALHCLVAYTLLTAALMRLDRLKIPFLWGTIHLLVPFVCIAIWPEDFGFAWADFQVALRSGQWFERFDFQFVGLCVGAFLGYQTQRLFNDRDAGLLFALAMIGICCGLAATISIGVMFLIVLGLTRLKGPSSFLFQNPLFLLLATFLLQIALWNFLNDLSWWPNNSANSLVLIAYLIPGTLAVAWATSTRPTESRQKPVDVESQVAAADVDDAAASESTGESNESGTQ